MPAKKDWTSENDRKSPMPVGSFVMMHHSSNMGTDTAESKALGSTFIAICKENTCAETGSWELYVERSGKKSIPLVALLKFFGLKKLTWGSQMCQTRERLCRTNQDPNATRKIHIHSMSPSPNAGPRTDCSEFALQTDRQTVSQSASPSQRW